MTVVSTAMPTVVAELGGALRYAWVFSAYMLTSTVTVPIYGKLADIYGRRPVMLASIGLFLLGSMASGQARTMDQLIVFRAIQGIGAGGMQPIAITIIGDLFDLKERARMQGVFASVWAIAGLVGPLLGGVIVATLGWRWVFYVNVPFGLVSAVVLAVTLRENVEHRDAPLDVAGALTLTASVIALLLGVDGVLPSVLLPASAVLAVAFLLVERKARDPMLPLSLFRSRVLATSSTVFATAGGAMIGVVTFLPLHAQGVLGASPTDAGATIAPMAITWPITSAVAGRILPRIGFRPLVRLGMVVVAVASAYIAWTIHRGATLGTLRIGASLFGVGMGLSNTALVIAVQTSVGFSQRGVVTASTMFFRNIGGTIAVGVMGVLLARRLLANGSVEAGGGAAFIGRILGPERRDLDPSFLRSIAGDLAAGLSHVGLAIAALALVGSIVALSFPREPIDDAGR